jgi:hypothetical protein
LIAAAAVLHSTPAPACRPEAIAVRLGRSEGAAGTIYVSIVFTNTGRVRCTLRGFPGVSSVDRAGRQIGSPARWVGTRVTRVALAPHHSGSAIYGQAQAVNFPISRCHPRSARGLRVYPPNQTRARRLISKHVACSSTRVGDSMVGPVVPGVTGQVG